MVYSQQDFLASGFSVFDTHLDKARDLDPEEKTPAQPLPPCESGVLLSTPGSASPDLQGPAFLTRARRVQA